MATPSFGVINDAIAYKHQYICRFRVHPVGASLIKAEHRSISRSIRALIPPPATASSNQETEAFRMSLNPEETTRPPCFPSNWGVSPAFRSSLTTGLEFRSS